VVEARANTLAWQRASHMHAQDFRSGRDIRHAGASLVESGASGFELVAGSRNLGCRHDDYG
jgi:hypothetical protein